VEVAREHITHGLEVLVRTFPPVMLPEDEVRWPGPGGLVSLQIDDGEIELSGQSQEGLMIRVDELAAPLCHLPIVPVAVAVRVHPAADPGRRLVNDYWNAGVNERMGRGEPRDTAAHNRDRTRP
jgi:hypothetical protein